MHAAGIILAGKTGVAAAHGFEALRTREAVDVPGGVAAIKPYR
jgi:hypothetical protein